MGHYEEHVKDRSAEQILQTAGGGSGGAVLGADGDYLRVAAQVRSTQELIEELKKASASNTVFSTRVFWLTVALVAVGGVQALATRVAVFDVVAQAPILKPDTRRPSS